MKALVLPLLCTVVYFATVINYGLSVEKSFDEKFNYEDLKNDIFSDPSCFCKLHGKIGDCACDVETVDFFNNVKVFPVINSLLHTDYFKFWKVNLHKKCPFWEDDGGCVLRDCAVNDRSHDMIPEGLKNLYSQDGDSCPGDNLGKLDTTISDETRRGFEAWRVHDDAQDYFCEFDDERSSEASYVDLVLNPERYTGYAGASPHRIWNTIYNENCFKLFRHSRKDYSNYKENRNDGSHPGTCLEQRIFYRMISGLHSSINIHLSASYLKSELGITSWGPNLPEFYHRFSPETTNGEGPEWLKNLYFIYLVELRALVKASYLLEKEYYYTGKATSDLEVQKAVAHLLKILRSFPDQFDESQMFKSDDKLTVTLKEDFKEKFRNISRIMDCVGCDKCKLWGKLQITGLGTALKILFSKSSKSSMHEGNFVNSSLQLKRQEIVALLNSFGRLSRSISEIEMFRKSP